MIGEALGAKVERSPEKEIGKFPITLTDIGQKNTLFSHFGKTLEVGHWHNDMPGLVHDANIIAYSNLVYGFQCHMEFTPEVIELLIINSEKDLDHATQFRFVESPDVLRAHDYQEMNQQLFIFLDKLTQAYLASKLTSISK